MPTATYDKYDPTDGGFRARLAADFATPADFGVVFAVGLDANGRVVKGPGNSGIKGALVLNKKHRAGDVVDVMNDGEIVSFPGVAGTTYYGAASGAVNTTNTGVYLGHTVEADRLVVRVKPSGGAA